MANHIKSKNLAHPVKNITDVGDVRGEELAFLLCPVRVDHLVRVDVLEIVEIHVAELPCKEFRLLFQSHINDLKILKNLFCEVRSRELVRREVSYPSEHLLLLLVESMVQTLL